MKVSVFGAGNMGARIAEVFLKAGHAVTMIDIKEQFCEGGKKRIEGDLAGAVKRGKMTQEEMDAKKIREKEFKKWMLHWQT